MPSSKPAATSRRAAEPLFFSNAEAFRAWLTLHAATEVELIVGFHKVGSGVPSITWPESVDEALCFGWIDGVRKRIDDKAYQIRFTPRRADSIWSAVNVAKVAELQARGRMQPAGLQAFARRTERKSSVYAYEQEGLLELSLAQLRELENNRAAWRYWQDAPPSYRRTMTYWVVSAKREDTRARRFTQLVAACAEQRRLLK